MSSGSIAATLSPFAERVTMVQSINSFNVGMANHRTARQDQSLNGVARWAHSSMYAAMVPIQDEIGRLAATRRRREFIPIAFADLVPVSNEGRFGFKLRRARGAYQGQTLYPDDYAAGQLGGILHIGLRHPRRLVAERTADAADVMVRAFENAAKQVPRASGYVLRVEDSETIRGILSERSCYVENEWYLCVLASVLPDGRLSSWRGDDWTIYGNLLIPTSMRMETDSAYGAMLSLSNCELGKRPLRQLPSTFRQICTNGCVAPVAGQAFRFSRISAVEQGELEKALRANIQDQLPIAVKAIDDLLATRTLTTTVSMKLVIAAAAVELGWSRQVAATILNDWWVEKATVADSASSLFGLVNAITRAGQRFENERWARFDIIGGALATLSRDAWEGLTASATRMSAREVDGCFSAWAMGV
jgi:hypothetical protein